MKVVEEAEYLGSLLTKNHNTRREVQARLAKKMTQAQLATAINERPQVIQEYENGKAIPNAQVLTKLDRTLGCHLPRAKKMDLPLNLD